MFDRCHRSLSKPERLPIDRRGESFREPADETHNPRATAGPAQSQEIAERRQDCLAKEKPERRDQRTEMTGSNGFGTKRADGYPVPQRVVPSLSKRAEAMMDDRDV